MSTSPAAANSVKDNKRSPPPAAKKPPANDGGMNFSEQERRLRKQMDAQAQRDAAISKAMKESHDTSKASTPNIK